MCTSSSSRVNVETLNVDIKYKLCSGTPYKQNIGTCFTQTARWEVRFLAATLCQLRFPTAAGAYEVPSHVGSSLWSQHRCGGLLSEGTCKSHGACHCG